MSNIAKAIVSIEGSIWWNNQHTGNLNGRKASVSNKNVWKNKSGNRKTEVKCAEIKKNQFYLSICKIISKAKIIKNTVSNKIICCF